MLKEPGPGRQTETLEDEELVALIQSGETRAFDEIVSRYRDRVYSYAVRMLGDPETANETAQDCFLRAYRYIGRFRGDAKFSTWFYTVVSSTCKNAAAYHGLRSRRREDPRPGLEDDAPSPVDRLPDTSNAPHAVAEMRDIRRTVRSAIDDLPEIYRQMIVLKDVSDLSYEEIAEILQCRLGTVKSRLARARLMMREKLVAAGISGPECDIE